MLCLERTPTFRLLVMELLGSSLSDLRHRLPKRQFSDGTMLRVGIQALEVPLLLYFIAFFEACNTEQILCLLHILKKEKCVF